MHIDAIDLNLLRLFDAVVRTASVSEAAKLLRITQPAASQGLTRLRSLLGDPLFVRSAGAMLPSARAARMAPPIRAAIAQLELALRESEPFDAATSQRSFRLHLSDIGEARFLPRLMQALQRQASGLRLYTAPLPHDAIAAALERGDIDLALGFLPTVKGTQHSVLMHDSYVLLVRSGHPCLRSSSDTASNSSPDLHSLQFATVRTHTDTLHILKLLQLESRLVLSVAHFLALPSIVEATDLAVILPREIATSFVAQGSCAIVNYPLPLQDFAVSVHSSSRQLGDDGVRWLRELVVRTFG
jgi:DNA-binding transcriptional LysR family regulator